MRKLRNSELKRVSTEEFKKTQKLPIIVVLDDVRSMHNVGSVFRTCDAFKIDQLILGGITPIPPLPEIEKTALGSTESVDWIHQIKLIDYLAAKRKEGYTVLAFEHTSKSKSLLDFEEDGRSLILIFGNEVKGVSDEVLALCDEVIEIPQYGTKHSLNISVSAGIGIWEIAKTFLK